MGGAQIYRKRAEECAELAAGAASSQHQSVWRELEQHWLQLAETLELYGQVDPFTAFIMSNSSKSTAH